MAIMRVRTVWTGSGIPGGGVTTNYFFVNTFGSTGAQAAVDLMRDFWTAIQGLVSNAIAWSVSGTVQEINVVTGQVVNEVGVTSRSGAGTATGDRLPAMTQGLLRLSTSTFLNGRRLRGHINIPLPTETDNTNAGVPQASYVTTLQNAANTLNAASDPTLNVYSREHGAASDVNVVQAVGTWAILRSRRD